MASALGRDSPARPLRRRLRGTSRGSRDPVTARNLDRLIVELRDTLGSTLVIVTHDLDSIFAVGTEAIYLDPKTCSILGQGAPRELLENPPAPEIADFLARTPRRENKEK